MIRMVGAVLLAAGSVMLGMCAALHMNCRVRELDNMVIGLRAMSRELEYRLAPLPELLKQASSQTEKGTALFFGLCARGSEHLNGRTFQSIWKEALEAGWLRLERTDLDILEPLGSVLGRYDCESQQLALKDAINKLEENWQEAKKQSGQLGKVYAVLSFTAGAFVLILMI